MPISNYKSIICLRPRDKTTDFLDSIGHLFGESYFVIEDNDYAHISTTSKLETLQQPSLIVFLGHGDSSSLHSASSDRYRQKNFITKEHSYLFSKHNALLLACRSDQFISKISGYQNIIGFGNIISSREEVAQEAEYTGEFRKIDDKDIEEFNQSYVCAIKNTLELLLSGKVKFSQVAGYISFFINKRINLILKNKSYDNRKEVARLLFEFRNEIKHLKGGQP